jgi:hypothetical protein
VAKATQSYHKRDLYTEVTSRILSELETGAAPTVRPEVITLARWLATNAVKVEWQAMGRRPEYAELAGAANAYFTEHREELIEEARAHPALLRR